MFLFTIFRKAHLNPPPPWLSLVNEFGPDFENTSFLVISRLQSVRKVQLSMGVLFPYFCVHNCFEQDLCRFYRGKWTRNQVFFMAMFNISDFRMLRRQETAQF